ncbi:MAG TPA: class I SAM-dependent methyltransferase [Polyangiaceae bacterium]|nr:class I SAM-dependent methyltransferase [Polyangiaceae bacterium]
MREVLRAAFERCAGVRERTSAYRLIDADGAEVPGLTVEAYGDYAVVVPYDEVALEGAGKAGEALLELGFLGVYLKAHLKTSAGVTLPKEGEPLCGARALDQFAVHEQQQQILIWLNEGQATGLFLDQRENRAKLRGEAQGKRVLNLFCYTGSFTVAAAVGGAANTISVDTAARALKRTGENLALNGCEPGAHRLLKEDARKWLGRAVKRAERFDWIVLDPPSFSRSGSDSFSVAKDYATMARQTLELLAPGGQLLAVTNHRATSGAAFTWMLKDMAGASRRTIDRIELLPPPVDCRDASGSSATKSVLLRVAR